MSQDLIFHICRRDEWEDAIRAGSYAGSSQDRADGFIHFSDGSQIVESARRHRGGQDDLVLVAVEPAALGPALKWEPSRSGALFPHLYGPLPTSAVRWSRALRLGPDGLHVFPPLA